MQQNKDSSRADQSPYLADLLQELLFEDFTGKIDVITPQEIGYVFLEKGYPIHAQLGKKEGDEALMDLLQLSSTTLTTLPNISAPRSTIQNKLEDLLIECALRMQNVKRSGTRLISTKSHNLVSKAKCFLEVQIPSGNRFDFPLEKSEISIGRSEDNVLCIPDPSLSSHHSLVFTRAGGYFIKDLNSINGTLLNHKPIQEAELKNGDFIQIGQITINFQSRLIRPQVQAISKARLKNPLQAQIGKKPAISATQSIRLDPSVQKSSSKTSPTLILMAVIIAALLAAAYFIFLR